MGGKDKLVPFISELKHFFNENKKYLFLLDSDHKLEKYTIYACIENDEIKHIY